MHDGSCRYRSWCKNSLFGNLSFNLSLKYDSAQRGKQAFHGTTKLTYKAGRLLSRRALFLRVPCLLKVDVSLSNLKERCHTRRNILKGQKLTLLLEPKSDRLKPSWEVVTYESLYHNGSKVCLISLWFWRDLPNASKPI